MSEDKEFIAGAILASVMVLSARLTPGEQQLDDLDRGDLDCNLGNPALDNQSQAYYTGYGARYVIEQMKSAGEFN